MKSTINDEVWRTCHARFGTCYDVSSHGRVRRRSTGRVLRAQDDGHQLRVRLSVGMATTSAVHRLVALAFIPGMHPSDRVHHLDGDHRNNRLDNLEARPRIERIPTPDDPRDLRLRGERHPTAKLTEESVAGIRKLFDAGANRRMIAVQFGVSRQTVHRIGRGEARALPSRLRGLPDDR